MCLQHTKSDTQVTKILPRCRDVLQQHQLYIFAGKMLFITIHVKPFKNNIYFLNNYFKKIFYSNTLLTKTLYIGIVLCHLKSCCRQAKAL